MTSSSWLFVKGEESIRVVRPGSGGLILLGPGPLRDVRDFANETDLQEYQVQLAERLGERGWILLAPDAERRSGQERRQTSRMSADRRASRFEAR